MSLRSQTSAISELSIDDIRFLEVERDLPLTDAEVVRNVQAHDQHATGEHQHGKCQGNKFGLPSHGDCRRPIWGPDLPFVVLTYDYMLHCLCALCHYLSAT